MLTIYAFKSGKAKTYASREGVIFLVDGKTHGHLPREFFTRKSVRMAPLKDSLLVVVECSRIIGRPREDLFMNSRDRLSEKAIRWSIESALEEQIRDNGQLKTLKAERREQEIQSKLVDQKPFEDVLRGVLKNSPALFNLLLRGIRVSKPFDTRDEGRTQGEFDGRRFPEFFHFKDKKPDERLERTCAVNRRARVQFDTDAEDQYFGRRKQKGQFDLYLIVDGIRKNVTDYAGPRLDSGLATIMIGLPSNCEVGDTLEFIAIVDDTSRVNPIENYFSVLVENPETKRKGKHIKPKDKKTKRDPKKDGKNPSDGGFSLPPTHIVRREEYGNFDPPFDENTALRISDTGEGDRRQWEYFVNGDNIFLKTEQKGRSTHPSLLENQFVYGMVLLVMGLLHEEEKHSGEGAIEDRVEWFSRAVAPMLVPVIRELGSLESDIGE